MQPSEAESEEYANQYYFYHYDVRGSVTNILSPAGTVVKGYDYDEFGQSSKKGDENFLNEMTFTGSVMDATSGLQYMNARYYQPSTGRFLSQDTYSGNPYDPWTQHLYSYTGNNPTSFIDPTGHFVISFLVGLAIGAVVGAAIGAGTELVEDLADDGEVNRPGEDYWGAAARGAIGGVAAAATGGTSLAYTTTTMAIGGALGSAVDQSISEGTIDYGQVAVDAITSGAVGGIFHGGQNTSLYNTSGDITTPKKANIKTQKPEVYKEPVRKELTGRAKNKLRPSSEAQGDHTVFKRDKTGKVSHYATYVKNPKNPSGFDVVKEFHGEGGRHFSKMLDRYVDTPHIHEFEMLRPPWPWELPRGYD